MPHSFHQGRGHRSTSRLTQEYDHDHQGHHQVERHLATLSEPADHIPLTIPEHFNEPTSQADQPMVEIDPTTPPVLKPLPSVATTLSPQVQPTEQQPTPNFGHSDLTKARTGHLPPSIAQGTLKRDPAAARIIGPDEFGNLATRLRTNPFKVKAEYGDRRILVSNWWDAFRGISQPQLVWSNQNRCTLVRSHWWLVSEGFSLSTANSDVQKLPAILYHRIADSLAYAA